MDHWHVRSPGWIERIKPALAHELRRAGVTLDFARGAMIFGPAHQPENVWLLEHGMVRIHRMAPGGQQLTIGLVKPGDLFGEVSVLGDSPRLSFAEAGQRSTCSRIPREVFLRVIRSDPDASFSLSRKVAGRMARIENRLEDLAFHSVDVRLARTLLRLAAEFGRPLGEWIEIDLSLTQSELATLVGASRQSVSECIQDFLRRGVIARDRGRLAIRPSALEPIGAAAKP